MNAAAKRRPGFASSRRLCFALALSALAGTAALAPHEAPAEELAEASAPAAPPPLLDLHQLETLETHPTHSHDAPLLTLRRIVIDPGHGGRNVGALGVGHIHEKHLTLPIAMHLADRLREAHPGLEVVLTRHADHDLGLAERAEIANRRRADLFVSIHLNSALNPEAVGVETWWVENCTPPIAHADGTRLLALVEALPTLAHATRQRCTTAESSRQFAEALHASYAEHLPEVFDRGIKRGNFTVLRQAEVPAVVAELGFLSHGEEGLTVLSPEHQARLVEALLDGIERYDAQRAAASQKTLAAASDAPWDQAPDSAEK